MYESGKRQGSAGLQRPTASEPTALRVPATDVLAAQRRALEIHLQRPAALQRKVAAPVLTAAALQREEESQLAGRRGPLQRQAGELGTGLPVDAISQALQRQAEQVPAPVSSRPQSAADWVGVLQRYAQAHEEKNGTSGLNPREAQQHTALQRQVAQVMAQSLRTDPRPALQRHADFAALAVTLQRHPLTSMVPRAALGMVTPGERPALQRAVDEAVQADILQRAQDTRALELATVQRQLADVDAEASKPVLDRVQARRGSGNPLPEGVRLHLEQGLNHDLSAVRIHDDAEADRLAKGVNAIAFTTGTDLYFQSGRFNPNTQTGLELLAHEVTHTVQQSQGRVGAGIDPDAGLESEARATGWRLVNMNASGARPSVRSAGAVPSGPARGTLGVQRKAAPPQAAVSPGGETVSAVAEALILLEQAPAHSRPFLGALAHVQKALASNAGDQAFWQAVLQGLVTRRAQQGLNMTLILQKLPPTLQARLNLALMGGEQHVTYEAFLNQLAFMSYGNETDLSDIKGMAPAKGNTVAQGAAKILDAAGYEAQPTIQGMWGFQMRVFQPVKGKKGISTKTVVAFRGTEGVTIGAPISVGPLQKVKPVDSTTESQKTNEAFLDSMTDFIPHSTGYSQFEANVKDFIDPVIRKLPGSLVAVGHSLGGALAQLTAARYASKFSEVHTFQGAKIDKADVDRAAQHNPSLKGTYFSINGDVVPGSGEASIPGQFSKFTRTGGKFLDPNHFDAVGGHNSPIMIQELRQLSQAGLVSKGNELASALVDHGSLDPNGAVTVTPQFLGTKGYPNLEVTKQAVVGHFLQAGTFLAVYRNNVAYNLYVERALPLLRRVTASSARELRGRLNSIHQQATAAELTQTASSRAMLFDILGMPEGQLASQIQKTQADVGTLQYGGLAVAALLVEKQRELENLKQAQALLQHLQAALPPAAIEESKARLLANLPSLWYAMNPDQTALYRKVKK